MVYTGDVIGNRDTDHVNNEAFIIAYMSTNQEISCSSYSALDTFISGLDLESD